MIHRIRRAGLLLATLMLMLGALAACGGGTSATPEARAESFFNDFIAAFNDPNLGDAAKQDEWADKLSKYFLPDQQAKQKEDVKQSFSAMPPGSMTIKIDNLKLEKVSESGDTAEVKIASGTMTMNIMGTEQTLDLASEGFGVTGTNAKMKKIDGVWYIDGNSGN